MSLESAIEYFDGEIRVGEKLQARVAAMASQLESIPAAQRHGARWNRILSQYTEAGAEMAKSLQHLRDERDAPVDYGTQEAINCMTALGDQAWRTRAMGN
jgi:hypothetical protein